MSLPQEAFHHVAHYGDCFCFQNQTENPENKSIGQNWASYCFSKWLNYNNKLSIIQKAYCDKKGKVNKYTEWVSESDMYLSPFHPSSRPHHLCPTSHKQFPCVYLFSTSVSTLCSYILSCVSLHSYGSIQFSVQFLKENFLNKILSIFNLILHWCSQKYIPFPWRIENLCFSFNM